MQADFLHRELLNTALGLFRSHGWDHVGLDQIADACNCPLDGLYKRFPRKESFIMGLFMNTLQHVESTATELPRGSVADRFVFLMKKLLPILEPDRELLRHMMPAMLDPRDRLGVLGPATDRIRAEVQGVYTLLVMSAEDAPQPEQVGELVNLLYFMHLGLIFLFLQDQRDDPQYMENGLELSRDLIAIARKTILRSGSPWLLNQVASLAGLPQPEKMRQRIDRLVKDFIHPPHDSAHFSKAESILRELFLFRRLQPGAEACAASPCPQCLALHLPKVRHVLGTDEPVQLVLPAFPAKSANLKKVTGPLPDLGEELALRFLQERCDAIAKDHEPGAVLTICSDGRVFSDVVGVQDEDVTSYRLELIAMIQRLGLSSLRVFDLDDIHPNTDYDAMREWLMKDYGESLEELEQRTREHQQHQQLFNGIHRFMFEDLAERQPELSRSQAKKQSKTLAYEVIRRSNAWSKLVAEFFPQTLRLSIHPQAAHSDKIGILLGEADDLWLTPWHGVALLEAERFRLTRRANAEQQGAVLVSRDGRSSHFEQPAETSHES